jgi:LysM repeat protein
VDPRCAFSFTHALDYTPGVSIASVLIKRMMSSVLEMIVSREAQQTFPNHQKSDARQGPGCLVIGLVVFLLVLLIGAGLFVAGVMQQVILAPYANQIYPNVYVLGENLGRLTTEQAAEKLRASFSDYAPGELILSDGEHVWKVPWSEAGLRFDADATAQQAFAAGRDRGWRVIVEIWLGAHIDVSPVFALDIEAARQALEQVAPDMARPPTDAQLRLEGDQVIAEPGRPGRELDIDATLEKIATTVSRLGPDYPFAPTFRAVPPRIADVSPIKDEAEAMLNREIHIHAYGTHEGETYTWDWTLGRETFITWLVVEKMEQNPGFAIKIDAEAVQSTLAELVTELEADDWGFPMEETSAEVLQTFEAGGGDVSVKLMPPPRIYVVQPGDHLTLIADKFGMPPGLIAEANADVDLNNLQIGQQLIIPPQEVLTPYDPVPGKKIVISIPEQRMRVYENEQLLYDWPVSTGIKRSPTYRGHFQVLDKEEEAYASQWDLWMPHFIAIYRAGGDTYNGIHGLPQLSSGQRLWAGNLGSRASYGCIILGLTEAETLYNWAEIGVPVIVE